MNEFSCHFLLSMFNVYVTDNSEVFLSLYCVILYYSFFIHPLNESHSKTFKFN